MRDKKVSLQRRFKRELECYMVMPGMLQVLVNGFALKIWRLSKSLKNAFNSARVLATLFSNLTTTQVFISHNIIKMQNHFIVLISLFKYQTVVLISLYPVNALRAQNLAGGHFLGHEIRLVFVSLSI